MADKKLGSSKVFLKITFPVPPIKKIPINNFQSIMGIDRGHRTFASIAIRSFGVGIDSHNVINPENIIRSTIFRAANQGLAGVEKHADRSRSLNAQSRYIQRSRYKFSVATKTNIYPLELTFTGQDHRFFHQFKLSRNISSVQLKKQSINVSVVHKTSVDILHLGLAYHVNKFMFEDLTELTNYYQSLGGNRQMSYYFSSSLFGQLISAVRYKSLRFGYSKANYIFENLASYTSQLCPFAVAGANKFLPAKKDERKLLNVHRFCKNGDFTDTNSPFIRNNKGETFLHNPLNDPHDPQRQILINRDFVGAFNLTYTK